MLQLRFVTLVAPLLVAAAMLPAAMAQSVPGTQTGGKIRSPSPVLPTALNPQPLPPKDRPKVTALNPQPLPPKEKLVPVKPGKLTAPNSH